MPRAVAGAGCLAAVVLALSSCPASAIEAPRPQPAATPAPASAAVAITPADENSFYEKLQRVTHYRNLRPLQIPDAAIGELAQGNAQAAVRMLDAAAQQGNAEANIALVRIQHWCNAIASSGRADPQAQIARLAADLPAERAARIAGVLHADAAFRDRARANCSKASFDYAAIETRLRAAAQAGHAPSATELAQFVRDPAKREALLQAAISRQYAPALHASASSLLAAVQRGQTTQNVAAIRELLKQAGRSLPRAKVDLANCMALGCDGHPADVLSAHAFGIDAARDGEPSAFASMVRMPWGSRLTRAQLLAWQYFGDRLNEAGCMGDSYPASAASLAQAIQLLEKDQPPAVLEAARAQAQSLWRDHSARAMKENGCEPGLPRSASH